MADQENKETKTNEPEQEQKPEPESKQLETENKPIETETGKQVDLMTEMKNMKQSLIDYIDLKFANAPIANEKPKEPESDEKKELPVW